jgi:hypothetical protein
MTETEQLQQAVNDTLGSLLAVAEATTKLTRGLLECGGKSDLETKENKQQLGIECAVALDSAAAHFEHLATAIRGAVKDLL